MIAIIDYDAGNLRSVEKALLALGEHPVVSRDRETILHADKVILPGVGSFGDAMEKLRQYDLVGVIRQVAAKGTPFLGICLGLQLMFSQSDESAGVEGLGILPGRILRIPPAPEDPAYRLEFSGNISGFPAVSGNCAGVLCVFCPFLLSSGGR